VQCDLTFTSVALAAVLGDRWMSPEGMEWRKGGREGEGKENGRVNGIGEKGEEKGGWREGVEY
jgi:hypothetical protein